jgi:hypothetical protein
MVIPSVIGKIGMFAVSLETGKLMDRNAAYAVLKTFALRRVYGIGLHEIPPQEWLIMYPLIFIVNLSFGPSAYREGKASRIL